MAAPAYGQRLAPVPPYAVASSVSVAATASFRFDSTKTIPRTYWLEGAAIGGVVMGVFTIGFAHGMSESPTGVADDAIAFLIGAAVGFPVGALIGGQFPKH